MYADASKHGYFSTITLVNYNENRFNIVHAKITDIRFSGMVHDRLDLDWEYGKEKNVDFISIFEESCNILNDFVNDTNVGAEKVIRYIKDYN